MYCFKFSFNLSSFMLRHRFFFEFQIKYVKHNHKYIIYLIHITYKHIARLCRRNKSCRNWSNINIILLIHLTVKIYRFRARNEEIIALFFFFFFGGKRFLSEYSTLKLCSKWLHCGHLFYLKGLTWSFLNSFWQNSEM